MGDNDPKPEKKTLSQEVSDKIANNDADMCCCCVCQCSDTDTREYKCCIIFPIKCGIQFIALLTLLVAIAQFLEIFYQLLNDNIDWWYVLVGVFLNVPIVVALAFVVVFFNKDKPSTRNLLWTAVLLTIIALTLSAIWNAVYFWFFYKHNDVVTGNDGVGFTHATRKQEIVFSAYIALVADCFFAYFLCVISNYIAAYNEAAIVRRIKELESDEEKTANDDPNAGEDAALAKEGDDAPKDGEEPKEEQADADAKNDNQDGA